MIICLTYLALDLPNIIECDEAEKFTDPLGKVEKENVMIAKGGVTEAFQVLRVMHSQFPYQMHVNALHFFLFFHFILFNRMKGHLTLKVKCPGGFKIHFLGKREWKSIT